MHPGRSSAKHHRAGKVRQSDARHTRKGQRGGVGVGEGGGGTFSEFAARVVGHWLAITILNLLVGRSDVDMVVRVVSRVNRNLIDRLVVRIVREQRTVVFLAHVVREGLGSTTASGARRELVELIEFVINLVEAQGLGLVAVGSGGLAANDIRKICVGRKLERELLHLATLNDLSRHRRPGALRVVRSELVSESRGVTLTDNWIIVSTLLHLAPRFYVLPLPRRLAEFVLGYTDVFNRVVMDVKILQLA